MFINKLLQKDLNAVNDNRAPMYREQSVVWASEGSVTFEGGISTGSCRRELFYKFMGIPETNPMSVRTRCICDAGIMYEDAIIADFKKIGVYVDEQVRMEYTHEDTNNKVISSGKMDLLVKEDDIFKGIEIKTISSYKVDKVFGNDRDFPLPAPKNLIQAMNYKKRAMQGPVLCNDNVERQIDEIYLLYIDRGTYQRMFFKVDLDEQDYAIITPIDQNGNTYETIHLQHVDSFNTLLHHSSAANSEQARLAELRFSLNDIAVKYDSIYDYVREKALPPKDYNIIYGNAEVDREFQCGRLSKIKYNQHYKKHIPIGDAMCSFCSYKDKCMADDGVTLN